MNNKLVSSNGSHMDLGIVMSSTVSLNAHKDLNLSSLCVMYINIILILHDRYIRMQ